MHSTTHVVSLFRLEMDFRILATKKKNHLEFLFLHVFTDEKTLESPEQKKHLAKQNVDLFS